MEELGNILFAEYTKLYYGGDALGSFYVIETEDPNKFSCGYFAKKGTLFVTQTSLRISRALEAAGTVSTSSTSIPRQRRQSSISLRPS